LISVGTSGIVTPAADLPHIALSSGATVIHVNLVDVGTGQPEEIMLVGRATEVLVKLCEFLSTEAQKR
ncbi:NAD-dependent deacylase, partial [Pseudomonas syringae]|nr:NAD-dependent deacylase [Pseudomonas syringae]